MSGRKFELRRIYLEESSRGEISLAVETSQTF